jgi:3D-(3,5/4)-trihydroxycyclohexane-1,2-dione acylhydrolase (decyclizing)
MGYEIPAGMGIRLAEPDPGKRVVVFIGDGTFLMMPSELVTGAQEALAVTVVIPDNRGYQVIHRLQMVRHGREFGNEFRYRQGRLDLTGEKAGEGQPRLDGDYIAVDLVEVAHGLGARAIRASTAEEVRAALDETRDHDGPVVIVVPVIPHVDLPGAGAWWDVAPSEVSEDETVRRLRTEYEAGLAKQRWWHG